MSTKEAEVVKISRLLKPEYKADLLAWVHLAFFAENSARKSLGIDAVMNGVSISEPREYSCGNLCERSKK
jgi:hydroxyacyl-ACP dehydratase HTD2-like protein with hotdog domain